MKVCLLDTNVLLRAIQQHNPSVRALTRDTIRVMYRRAIRCVYFLKISLSDGVSALDR